MKTTLPPFQTDRSSPVPEPEIEDLIGNGIRAPEVPDSDVDPSGITRHQTTAFPPSPVRHEAEEHFPATSRILIDALDQENEELRQAVRRAETAARNKDLFLASMSHEIRTQLNGMIGIQQLMLEDKSLPSSTHRCLETMKRSSNTLLHILNDILDYTQSCSYEIRFETHRFSPRQLVEDVIAAYSANAESKGLSLLSMVADKVPSFVEGDETRLRQILSNLVSNSIKFTESGRVGIFLSAEPASKDKIELQFQVLDTGIGMTRDQLSRLFQHFSQADASTNRKFGGSGLGLLISKNLIEQMGGNISVESEIGKGSEFQFWIEAKLCPGIPENLPAPGFDVARPENAGESPRNAMTNIKVLVAEDDEVNQMVVRMTLERLGVEVDVVENGAAAVAAVQQNDYAVIFMDLTMPEVDGIEATRRIRALEGPQGKTPIFAMTGHAFPEDREKCLDSGMNEFIPKPFEIADLKTLMTKALGERERR